MTITNMNPTGNPRKSMKRAIGLGIAVLSISLLGSLSRADNTAVGSAHLLTSNSLQTECVNAGADEFFFATLTAGRSYELWVYVPDTERNSTAGVPGFYTNVVVDDDQAFGSPLSVTQNQFAGEGGPQNNLFSHSRYVAFTVTATANYFVRVTNGSNTGCYRISLRETTLFSPWTSKAAGFEGFIEVHNNTAAAINVTLQAYNSAGVLQGAGLTFSIPGNATMFQTAAAIGVPVGVFAGVVLTHNGTFGAIAANITTLNGATGLSFDSPFTPRTENLRQH